MTIYELYAEIAKWVGWPAVSALLILIIATILYVTRQHTLILQERILKLQSDIDSRRDFLPDQLLKRLLDRHAVAMREIGELQDERNVASGELARVKEFVIRSTVDFLSSMNENPTETEQKKKKMTELYGRLDYCKGCEDDPFFQSAREYKILSSDQFIVWGDSPSDDRLVDELDVVKNYGVCNSCLSPAIKCRICGSVNELYLYSRVPDESIIIDCKGKCGVKYQLKVGYSPSDFSIFVIAPKAS